MRDTWYRVWNTFAERHRLSPRVYRMVCIGLCFPYSPSTYGYLLGCHLMDDIVESIHKAR